MWGTASVFETRHKARAPSHDAVSVLAGRFHLADDRPTERSKSLSLLSRILPLPF